MASARQAGIEARFPSECVRCGGQIVRGQRIILRRGCDPIHVECAPGADDE